MDCRKGIVAGLLLASASIASAQQMLHIPVNGAIQTVPVSTGPATGISPHAKHASRTRTMRGNLAPLGPTEDCSERRAILQAAMPYHIASCAAWAFRLKTRHRELILVDFSLTTDDETDISYGPVRGPIPFGLFDPMEDQLSFLNDGESLRGKVQFLAVPADSGALNIITSFERTK